MHSSFASQRFVHRCRDEARPTGTQTVQATAFSIPDNHLVNHLLSLFRYPLRVGLKSLIGERIDGFSSS
jgi:hypothetical protein